jgi:hypothetical protein
MRTCEALKQQEIPMKAANDNDPLPFIQIAAAFRNVMTYLSLEQKKPANDADRNVGTMQTPRELKL